MKNKKIEGYLTALLSEYKDNINYAKEYELYKYADGSKSDLYIDDCRENQAELLRRALFKFCYNENVKPANFITRFFAAPENMHIYINRYADDTVHFEIDDNEGYISEMTKYINLKEGIENIFSIWGTVIHGWEDDWNEDYKN